MLWILFTMNTLWMRNAHKAWSSSFMRLIIAAEQISPNAKSKNEWGCETQPINNWSCCIYWTDGERETLQKPTREKGNRGTRPQAMLEWMRVRICGINWLEVRVVRITWCSTNQGPIEGSVYQSTQWGNSNVTAPNTKTTTAEFIHKIRDIQNAFRTLCTPARWIGNKTMTVRLKGWHSAWIRSCLHLLYIR